MFIFTIEKSLFVIILHNENNSCYQTHQITGISVPVACCRNCPPPGQSPPLAGAVIDTVELAVPHPPLPHPATVSELHLDPAELQLVGVGVGPPRVQLEPELQPVGRLQALAGGEEGGWPVLDLATLYTSTEPIRRARLLIG